MKNFMVKKDVAAFNMIGYVIIILFSAICILPFMLTLSGSLSSEESLFQDGYRLIPKALSFDSYALIFKAPEIILNAYGITVSLVILGTLSGLLLTSMTSYVLQRKDFKYRNKFAFFFFFTTLFSGGLVPWYIIMVGLGFKNSYLALLVPQLFSVFNIIIMRTFFQSIPESIGESAKIDGAGDFVIFLKLYLPMSVPGLVTVGLFIALGYWNDWYLAYLFITKEKLVPLQYHLYKIFNSMQVAQQMAEKAGIPVPEMPKETFKLAMTMVVTGPIILLYPFVNKYFIKGMTIGAVKG